MKLGEKRKFTLIAHSIGGYISSFVYDRYKNNITKLILLSPAGFLPNNDEYNKKKYNKIVKNFNFILKPFVNFFY